jgi:hypothetical protein
MLKNLGIASWIGCILVIVFQAATWFFTASWPSVTLMDGLTRLGWNPLDNINTLSMDLTVKTAYVLLTTQLSVALWWLGAGLIGLAVIVRILFRK